MHFILFAVGIVAALGWLLTLRAFHVAPEAREDEHGLRVTAENGQRPESLLLNVVSVRSLACHSREGSGRPLRCLRMPRGPQRHLQ